MRRALLAGLLLFLLPCPAQADLKLCNRTSYVLYAATSTIKNTDSLTQGWTRLFPGDCGSAIKGALGSASYLVHARSSLAHAGAPRAWGGAFPVCVKDASFLLHQTVTQPYCVTGGTFALPFAPVDLKGHSDWVMNFDDAPALPSLTAAQLAGVKRLLTDNGYAVGAINDVPSKPTGAALNDFRRKMRLKPEAGNAALFAALEKQALKTAAPQGYAVCNESKEPLLIAIGQTGPEKPSSRGWWRIASGACARALTTPLNGQPVFLLAQSLSGAVLAGGAQKFCTTARAFAVDGRGNCAARGLGEAGFASTAGHGKTGTVVRINAKGLMAEPVQARIAK